MKRIKQIFKKTAPAFVAFLSLVLMFSANTSACYFFNQPVAPKSLDSFKRIK